VPVFVLPLVLCIDIEPDRRVTERGDRQRPRGADLIISLVPRLRERLATLSGGDAHYTWCIRMDPQIRDTYGAADWLATAYEHELEAQQCAGDEVGLHQHSWRWRDGGWVSDQADEAWVAHCVDIGLETFRSTFGRDAKVYRHGDGYMSNAIARQIDTAGVRVDYTLEPGHDARPGIKASEASTGMLPDTRTVPRHAYRPSAVDFRVEDASRRSGTLFLPLTAGMRVTTAHRDGRLVPTGSYTLLELWSDPTTFSRMLRGTIRDPELTHLAFALRTDIGLLPTAVANVERNLEEISRQLDGREHRWCTALTAADEIETRHERTVETRAQPDRGLAALWLEGEADAGYRSGAESEALEALMDDAGALADRLRSLGMDASIGEPAVSTRQLSDASRSPTKARPAVRWVDEDGTMSCPLCSFDGPARRVAMALWGHEEIGVMRCPACRSLVLERVGAMVDLPDEMIDGHLEFTAGIDAVLVTLGRVEPRRGMRLLDVGCGYGFALDLAHFAWGWRGIGVDPSNWALRGEEELGVEIRPAQLDPSVDLGDEPFDVAIASEALEHIQEPLVMLETIRSHLADDGVLVLSTPNAEFIRPGNSLRDVAAALGTGGHAFLASREGLDQALRRAGFGAVIVDEDAQTLRAIASPTQAGLDACRTSPGPLDLDLLARYCDARAASAAPGSALRLGMAARSVQYALHANELSTAEGRYPRLREAVLDRHGIDIEAPSVTIARAVDGPLPAVVAGAHFSAGFLDLVARERPASAAEQFRATAAAAASASAGRDPGITWLQLRAIGHEALALARSDPERVPDTLVRLRNATHELIGTDSREIDDLCAQSFRELVARGHLDAADAARMLVNLPDAWIHDESVEGRAALDTIFSLGTLALQRERPAEAAAFFALCARLAADSDVAADHDLARRARDHEGMALEALGRVAAGTADPPAAQAQPAKPSTAATPVGAARTRSPHGVSIIIPLFNGARYLREAVESVAVQTMVPDELIIVDDGSTDEGHTAVDEIDVPFPIRVIRQSRAGQSMARNRGVAASSGGFIAFLDQDDTWHPEHLAALTAPLVDDPMVGWAFSDFDEIDDEGRTVIRAFLAEHGIAHPRTSLASCIAEDLMVIPSASVLRRSMFETLGGFDALLQGFEDDDLYVRAFRAGWRLEFVPRSLTRFRVHTTSSSAQRRFGESRRYFSQKLRETVADDRRLNRFYGRDVIAPRFLRSALNDYVRAISDKDWETAKQMTADMRYFASFHRDRRSLRWKLFVMRSPRASRRLLRLNSLVPLRSRRMRDPVLRLR
jgi:glycosyltransferase involved in cell wall biosynthesis/SAM-dependent methyltransferase